MIEPPASVILVCVVHRDVARRCHASVAADFSGQGTRRSLPEICTLPTTPSRRPEILLCRFCRCSKCRSQNCCIAQLESATCTAFISLWIAPSGALGDLPQSFHNTNHPNAAVHVCCLQVRIPLCGPNEILRVSPGWVLQLLGVCQSIRFHGCLLWHLLLRLQSCSF